MLRNDVTIMSVKMMSEWEEKEWFDVEVLVNREYFSDDRAQLL